MTHERARAELSARFDGEGSDELSGPLAEHLTGCSSCRQWERSAEVVTTQVRRAPVPVPPDRTEQLLAAVLADQAPRRSTRGRFLTPVRAGLAAAAAGQFVLIVPALVFGNAGGGTPVHSSHELGAFNLALAVGFAVAALRPSLARGMLPFAGVTSVTLFVLASVDSAQGYTTLAAEAPHLITVFGSLLLLAATRAVPDTARRWRPVGLSEASMVPKGFHRHGIGPDYRR
jgi:predicted anti-sigma-YlaC factor YlaD